MAEDNAAGPEMEDSPYGHQYKEWKLKNGMVIVDDDGGTSNVMTLNGKGTLRSYIFASVIHYC